MNKPIFRTTKGGLAGSKDTSVRKRYSLTGNKRSFKHMLKIHKSLCIHEGVKIL